MTDAPRVREAYMVQIVAAPESAGFVDTPIPRLRRAKGYVKLRKTVREEITEIINNAAPDVATGPIIEAVLNVAREKGWK